MAIFSRSLARKIKESERPKKCLLRKAGISMPKLSLAKTWSTTLTPWAKKAVSTPVRTQTGNNCVPFAAQTAMEVLLNKPCPLVDVAPQHTKNHGMAMCVYWNEPKVRKTLEKVGVDVDVVCLLHTERAIKVSLVKEALIEGKVAVIGTNLPMAVDKHAVRRGRGMERHSVTVVGYLEDYLVVRDTQGPHFGRDGLSLVPVAGLDIEELVVLSRA